jgi:cytochrome c556
VLTNKRKTTILLPLALVFVVTGTAISALAPRVASKLPTPEHVSADTRAELKSRMAVHGTTMSSLVQAVVLLDRPAIKILATRIADAEVIARNDAAGAAKKPIVLPDEFFVQQTKLADAARQLAATAASAGEDAALAEQFSTLTRTCISCHSAYLHGQAGTPPPEPQGDPKAKTLPPRP